MKCVHEMRVRKASLKHLKAFETDGRPIPIASLKQRLVEDTLVVVSGNDQMIPDYYAALFKPGTIVLAFEPMRPQPAPAAPVPQPFPAPGAPQAPQAALQPGSAALAGARVRAISQVRENEEEASEEIHVPEHAPAPGFPETQQPVFIFASRDDAEHYRFRKLTENSYETTGYKVKRQGTGKQMIPVQMTQTVRQNDITTINAKDLQFFAGDGSSIPEDRVKEKLSRELTVLYSAMGEPVDEFWLQNLRPTTLVIAGPQLPGCGMPMGYGGYAAPMPAPGHILQPPVAVPTSPPESAPIPNPNPPVAPAEPKVPQA
jgi:hypothetical protein